MRPKRQQVIKFLLSIDAATAPIAPNAAGSLAVTSAAANIGAKLAPDSIGSAYGSGLAVQSTSAGVTAPVVLGGSTIAVQDAAGALRLGQMFLASPGQVNFLLPAATPAGRAQITVTSASGAVATGSVDVAAVTPSIFSLGGTTVAAAVAVRVAPGGAQSPVAVFQCAGTTCTAAPIDLGSAGDSVFLTLFGTGLRKNSGLGNVRATIGGADAPVAFAGAQGEFAGLDQVNVQIPVSSPRAGRRADRGDGGWTNHQHRQHQRTVSRASNLARRVLRGGHATGSEGPLLRFNLRFQAKAAPRRPPRPMPRWFVSAPFVSPYVIPLRVLIEKGKDVRGSRGDYENPSRYLAGY